ncbi:DUF1284 domain-containing protein [Treponema sp.]|uniref:DUF1284 domain-containing protein n=1 Tax=Treponema sp. TaxID=166 RepID=UPI003FA23D99
MNKMNLNLRPHHLLCTRAFRGKGYSPAFVENMSRVIAEIKNGACITLTAGFDDICAACPEKEGSVCKSEEKVQTFDARVLERFHLERKTYSYTELEHCITEYLDEASYEYICCNCEWRQTGVCTYTDVQTVIR